MFDSPDRFVAGTVGEPGDRTFYLQVRQGRAVVSVVLEKAQVAALAERLGLLLTEVRRRGQELPDLAAAEVTDSDPLDQPVVGLFRVGAMVLAWDAANGAVVVEARAQTESDEEEEITGLADDDEDGPDLIRVRISPKEAIGFIQRASQVLAGGRPSCPMCGLPLNPEGHICPRQNGRLN